MPIMVCDAIMGSGKSSAIIQHMNRNPEKRYLYITPFLEEARRIREACPQLFFAEPSDKSPDFGFSKYSHILHLLAEGRNIASTHQMFRNFKPEVLELVRAGHYTLIIDEAVDVFQELTLKKNDLDIVTMMGWLDQEGNNTVTEDTPLYQGERFRDIFDLTRNGNFAITYGNGETYYWVMSRGFFDAFEDVYILTYLFAAQTLKYYLDIHNIPFRYIGISHPSPDEYYFSEEGGYIPTYVGSLSEKIHILENSRLNDIGNPETALSSTWFKRRKADSDPAIKQLRSNISNFFRHINEGFGADQRLWSTFKDAVGSLRGKGFYNHTLSYNARASNQYRHKRVLAYCVNIYMKPEEKTYFTSHGIDVLEDEAALSTMIQWIWRSAIRDGQEIWIYIPSRRMRTLLLNWIKEQEEIYQLYLLERENER